MQCSKTKLLTIYIQTALTLYNWNMGKPRNMLTKHLVGLQCKQQNQRTKLHKNREHKRHKRTLIC